MYKLCKTEQAAARQRQLELGLLEALKERHYDEVSVSDLCDRMQIPRKSFYRYFSGKDGALNALIDHTLLEFEIFYIDSGNNEARTRAQLENFFLFWRKNRTLLAALTDSNLQGVLIERSIRHALSDYSVARHFGNEQQILMAECATQFAVCGLMSILLRWHESGYTAPAARMADIAVEILTHPLI